MKIHPTAIVSPQAEMGSDVEIGPYSVIVGDVSLGRGTRVYNHVTIGCESGRVRIGENNQIMPGAVVGGPPQDLSYKGETTELKIGNHNVIREFVTINLGTKKDGGQTTIGNEGLFMSYVHIAHDCHIGDRVVIANSCQFAGHVAVENDVKIGGGCLFNQFIRIGQHSYIAGDSAVRKDVLPFSIAQGADAVSRATNKIGLQRAGIEKSEVENIHKAIRFLIKGDRTIDEALEKIRVECDPSDYVSYLIDFVRSSERGVAR